MEKRKKRKKLAVLAGVGFFLSVLGFLDLYANELVARSVKGFSDVKSDVKRETVQFFLEKN